MHFKAILAIATLWLVTAVHSTVIGAPINVKNSFAIELPATNTHALAPRATDPLECDGWCWGDMHCCLIANTYSRRHYLGTPCSKISFPNGLRTPAPHPPLQTTTAASSKSERELANSTIPVTQTKAATTVIITVSPAAAAALVGISAGQTAKEGLAHSTAAPSGQIVTETTIHIISVTATKVVSIVMSPIPPPITTPSPSVIPVGQTDPTSATTTNNTAVACSTCSNTTTPALDTEIITTSSGDPNLGTESDGIPATVTQQSTITSISVGASTTTTSTASLEGEPSAIASSLVSNGAAAVAGMLRDAGGIVLVGLGVLGEMAAVL